MRDPERHCRSEGWAQDQRCPDGQRNFIKQQEQQGMTRKDRTEGIYSRREVLDDGERRQFYLIQLKELLTYAYRYSEAVKKRVDRAQFTVEKFQTLTDLKHIPILKKKELIFLQSMGPRLGGLLTKDIGELKRIFLSPGPIFDPEDRVDDYWGYTEAFYSVGFRPGDVTQITFNYHLAPAGLMFEEPLRNLGCAVMPAGPGNAVTQLEIMQKLRIQGFVGTPSYLMHLAQKAEEKGLNLRKELFLEVAFVTGEKFSEKMRNQMEKKFDLIMRQGYGTADVGCVGYECFHKTGLHIANRAFVEICHPDTGIPLKDGEVGEVVVTAFNKTYPLIRLATGDLSYIDRSPCACGRTSPRLGNIVGRVDTTARIKGMFVYPHQVEQVIARFEEIKRWQIEVTNSGGIDEMVLLVESSNFKREDELLHQFREKIKLRPELKVLAPGTLPPQIKPIEDKRSWD
jgi:phenylacetate-CoA ligase